MSCIVQRIDGRNTGGKALYFTVRTPLSSTLVHGNARIPADRFDIPRALGRLQSLNSITEIIVVNADSNPSGLVRLTTCVIALLDTPT